MMPVAPPPVETGPPRHAVDLPHLGFATAIAGWAAWFCWDAWRSAPDLENMILILPVSVAALIIYMFVAAGCFRRITALRPALARPIMGKIVGTMGLLAVFVLAAPVIGFDVACFGYILLMLLFLGERRVPVLLLVPTVFCGVVIYGFNTILATPLPSLLFQGDGP